MSLAVVAANTAFTTIGKNEPSATFLITTVASLLPPAILTDKSPPVPTYKAASPLGTKASVKLVSLLVTALASLEIAFVSCSVKILPHFLLFVTLLNCFSFRMISLLLILTFRIVLAL